MSRERVTVSGALLMYSVVVLSEPVGPTASNEELQLNRRRVERCDPARFGPPTGQGYGGDNFHPGEASYVTHETFLIIWIRVSGNDYYPRPGKVKKPGSWNYTWSRGF